MKDFLKTLLLPIARLCLRNGVFLPELIDSLKQALFEAAVQHLEKEGTPPTASRLSVMTGLHRKDTSQMLGGREPERSTVPVSIKVIGAWQAKKRFLDKAGKPRRLSIGNEESEFVALVREVSADVHPRTVFDELQRLHLIESTGDEVRLLKTSYSPAFSDPSAAELISRDTDTLLRAVEETVCCQGPRPNHHTTTEYDNIPPEFQQELRRWIVREAGAFHKKVREHVSSFDRDLNSQELSSRKNGRMKFTFCSFNRFETLDEH